MKNLLLALVAVVVGLVVSFVLVIAVEFFSAIAHPFPEDFGGTNEEVCLHVERIPPWVLAVAVPAWALTAFAGTWTARKIGNIYSAAIVGLLLLAALVLNLAMLPYPIWFKVACLIAVPAAMIAGCRRTMRNAAATAS